MSILRSRALGLLSLVPLGVATTVACGSVGDEPTGSAESFDRIQAFDDPYGLLGAVSRKAADNITAADVGGTFGVVDDEVPYPDTYWPMIENGIDAEWNGSEKSPLEKFITMASPENLDTARAWNRINQGVDMPGVEDWYGICNGWTGASTSVKPLKHGVTAKIVDGQVKKCSAAEAGCTTFEIGDINALMATIYSDGFSYFIGARCNTVPAEIQRDAFGRVKRRENAFIDGAGCKGLNPGSLMIVLNHRLKIAKKPMVMNAQTEAHTEQIWNQPAYRYKVNRYEVLTEAQAANLVASNSRDGTQTRYVHNLEARGFAFVDVSLMWIREHGPNKEFYSGLRSSKETRMTAVLEMDKPLTDPTSEIVGGEYIDDTAVGTNRLKNAPFLWISTAPGPEIANTNSYHHNPYVKTSVVQQLIDLSLED